MKTWTVVIGMARIRTSKHGNTEYHVYKNLLETTLESHSALETESGIIDSDPLLFTGIDYFSDIFLWSGKDFSESIENRLKLS